MHDPATSRGPGQRQQSNDPLWLRVLLIGLVIAILSLLIVIPIIAVFAEALANGIPEYFRNLFADPYTRHSIFLTLTVAPIAVLANVVFGLAAAWLIARYRFPGRTILVTLLDLPFAISPVVAGLMFVILFGANGYLGPWVESTGIKLIFAWPGLVLVTTFVTMPFVARELLPVMESIGADEELAAISLGASFWQMYRLVTIPNIRWALLYGVILCNARAMGEFGAVYVVSGRISGQTDTMPLRVQKLYEDYNNAGAFAVASLLTLLAVATLINKTLLEYRLAWQREAAVADATTTGEAA